ncbi:2-dehydro-3-deoxy-6-phosphogalactonate aldolase [Gilvimarinus chinensis]|uniref:2-dehydro-3-deoxy-6-phosphogalactonate aldolase n=1 Tax=Gilvimarinus chinensis TaxID=396005 RepID=UPI000363E266|nr:2-dehydro-3-deoxy-6-phosphogalactonate aldolase [Gilvimarinus chinensis]
MSNLNFIDKSTRPLIAILRGVTENDVLDVSKVLIEEGISIIEVPLNSPNALRSIEYLVETFGDRYLVGAGTVTNVEEVDAVISTGAKLIVTPNFNAAVVERASRAGCVCLPGVVTPTEAFAALAAGAHGLKLFPVTQMGFENFKALMSVLPKGTACFPVGGISAEEATMAPYLTAGAAGFGIGSSLYTAGLSTQELRKRAQEIVSTFDRLCKAY